MGCCHCTTTGKKWTTFGVGAAFLVLGLILVIFWRMIVHSILNYELSVSTSSTISYNMWKETPIPMYLSFYFFNWTNSEEVRNDPSIKPNLTECGPYTFYEHHFRDNVTFNDNATVSFYNRRTWRFVPEKSSGNLTDKITTFNPILACVGNIVKDKHYIVQMGVNFFLQEKHVNLTVTKTVNEFTFTGYDDPMLDLLHKLNLTGLNIPFTKFGWFAERNNSVEYDGYFNMEDGAHTLDNLGIVRYWNYQDTVPYYDGKCGKVEGTQGELWYPTGDHQTLKVFSNDLCSALELKKNNSEVRHGLKGYKYVATEKNFDNGTRYPEMSCYLGKNFVGQQYSGVRNVSLCKFGAPALVSFPHFYLADPYYLEAVNGLKPDEDKHAMYMILEPNTGLPLSVRAQIQLNLKVEQIKHITLLSNVAPRLMPMFWFSQTADLTSDLSGTVKMVLTLPSVGQYTGYGLLGLGVLIAVIGFVITYRKGWQDTNKVNGI